MNLIWTCRDIYSTVYRCMNMCLWLSKVQFRLGVSNASVSQVRDISVADPGAGWGGGGWVGTHLFFYEYCIWMGTYS